MAIGRSVHRAKAANGLRVASPSARARSGRAAAASATGPADLPAIARPDVGLAASRVVDGHSAASLVVVNPVAAVRAPAADAASVTKA